MLLLLHGCGPRPKVSPTRVVHTATATRPPTSTPAPTRSPTPTSFVAKAVFRLFVQSPLSGNQAIFGTDILRGAELAALKLGNTLREQRFQVEVVAFDDRNSPEIAMANAAEILNDPRILCGVGHYDSAVTAAAADIYHRGRLALVAPAAAAPRLTARGYPEINRIIGREDLQGLAAAQFAGEEDVDAVYIISHKGEYGLRNAEHFRTGVSRLGIKVLSVQIVDINPLTTVDLVHRVMAADPALVYAAGTAEEVLPLFKAMRAAGYNGILLGLDELNNPPAINRAGSSLTQGGGLYFTISTAPANHYPAAADFIADFGLHFASPPLLFAARSFDAAGICLKAIENVLAATGGEPPTRPQVASAVRAIEDYEGITGTYSFNRQGNSEQAEYYIYKIVSVETVNWDQNLIIGSYVVQPP